MQTYCDHSATTQACTPVERNRALYGSANSSREFTLWQTVELPVIWDVVTFMWRHCNEIGILSLYHPYEITFEIRMSSVWLNQIIPISLQWRYMSTITSHITGDTTVCSCASAAWQQRKYQSSTYCPFLGVSPRWLVDSLHKGQVMWKAFPCHGVINSSVWHRHIVVMSYGWVIKSSLRNNNSYVIRRS